jgi:hypothetical protein
MHSSFYGSFCKKEMPIMMGLAEYIEMERQMNVTSWNKFVPMIE